MQDLPRQPPPADLRAILDDALADLRGRSFADMADAQRFIGARVHAYNTRPQRELGGLSSPSR